MNYRSLCLLVSAFLVAPLYAQDVKIPPMPSGPLLKRAPDFSTWTITFQGHAQEEPGPAKTGTTSDGAAASKEKERPTKVSTTVKTGSTILEQSVDETGQQHQIWHVSGIRVLVGSHTPLVCPDYVGNDIYSINFASSDFAGLSWVTPNSYAGMVKYLGNDCIVCTGTVSPLTEKDQVDERAYIEQAKALGFATRGPQKVAAAAYIDLQTRLPLLVIFGKEKRVYQYGPPPQVPLSVPAELSGPVKTYAERINRLSAPPARGF